MASSNPFAGAVTEPYGPTSFASEPAYDGYAHFHQGVDFAASQGAPVDAPQGGTVIGNSLGETGYGPNLVLVKMANGLIELFGHMSQAFVRPGQQVLAGQEVGTVGSLGNSTGPHLHYGVLTDTGAPVDPTPYLPGASAVVSTPGVSVATAQGQQASGPGAPSYANIPVVGGILAFVGELFGGLFRVILTILGVVAILIGLYILFRPDDAPGVGDLAKAAMA